MRSRSCPRAPRRSAVARPSRILGAAAVALTLIVLAAAPATGAPPPGTARVAALRAQVRSGELLRTHGTKRICPRCDGLVVTATKGGTAPLSTAAPAGYGPGDLARAYHLPTSDAGARTTVAVIDAGVDPHLGADLATYRRRYGLPRCTTLNHCLRTIGLLGGQQPVPPTTPAGRYFNEQLAVETSLDMDLVSAGCPSCKLIEISVPWQNAFEDNDVSTGQFTRAVDTAVRAGADVISISYGYSANDHNTSGSTLRDFTRPGRVIVASTGDAGFNGGLHQSWPSDLPGVVAVGGTSLPRMNGRFGPQTAWGSAGSGCETNFPRANGQPNGITALCGNHRAASDISADADPATGLAVFDTYSPSSGKPAKWTVVGGTSASAPFIAGLYARAGQLATVNGPNTLYAAPRSDFTDVTTGATYGQYQCRQFHHVSVRLCNASVGWDGPTGLGTPDGLAAFRPDATTPTFGGRS